MLDRGSRMLTVGITLLFLSSSCYFFSLTRPGLGTAWKQEQPPPEAAVVLELGPNGELLAVSASGNRYRNFPQSGLPWETYTGEAETNQYGVYCFKEDGRGYIIFPPPGNTISRVSESCGATESAYHVEVALLGNGEIWSWMHGSSALGDAILPLFFYGAIAVGGLIFLIGLGLKLYDQ